MSQQKGKLGICLWFYTVVAFLLAVLGQTLLCGLTLGFVIAVEKNEWLTKQCIQAFFLALISSIVNLIVGALNTTSILLQQVPFAGAGISAVFGLISGAISIVLLIFAIIAMVNTVKGRDANLPGLRTIAERAYGHVIQKTYGPAAGYRPQQPGGYTQGANVTGQPQQSARPNGPESGMDPNQQNGNGTPPPSQF